MDVRNDRSTPLFTQLSFTFILVLCLLGNTLWGQSWLYNYPNLGNGFEAVEAANGDLLVIGHGVGNSEDNFVVRLDAEGAMVWQLTLASDTSTWSPTIIRTFDDNYVAAYRDLFMVDDQQRAGLVLRKFDDLGNTIWETTYVRPDIDLSNIRSLEETSDHGMILSGRINDYWASFVIKLDENGTEEWYQEYPEYTINRAIEASNGDLLLAGRFSASGSPDAYVYRTDNTGEVLWQQAYGEADVQDFPGCIIETIDGGIALLIISTPTAQDMAELIKTDMSGDVIWTTQWETDQVHLEGSSELLHQKDDGVFAVAAPGSFGAAASPITLVDADGTILSQGSGASNLPVPYNLFALTPTANGGFAIIGGDWIPGSGAVLTVAKTNAEGEILQGYVQGNVFLDEDQSCSWNEGEGGLANWVVTAVNTANQQTFSASTDSLGNYELALFDGNYEISVALPTPVWLTCPILAVQTVTITTQSGDPGTEEADFPIQALYECPVMTVDISTPFLRRCFPNTYYVNYCNIGTATATDAYVEVVLDDFMTFTLASIPYENQMDSLLVFPIGDVAVGECGQFLITANVDCETTILGQMHCTEAHIYPDDYCLPFDVDWDMSSISLEGICEPDSVRFKIRNEGVGNMSAPLNYIIVVDEVIMLQGDFQLESGQVKEVAVFADGETYRIEAEQSPGHPEGGQISFTLDGCPDFGVGGFVNWFAEFDFLAFQDVDCQPNVGAYDPNDKNAFPRGYGDAHQIEPGTEIEYLVRFQNTGTDTAFRVVIRDELSQHLDAGTLRMGVASHDYEWEIVENNTLKVIFDNIMLPDSNVNEAASHGFFKFRILPKETTELGTVVENDAGIYFDFNAPIITNTVFHTIDTSFVLIDGITFDQEVNAGLPIQVFPNPLRTTANFVLSEHRYSTLQLDVFDAAGRLVQQFTGSGDRLTMPADGFSKGVYFYRLYGDHGLLGTGKLIVID